MKEIAAGQFKSQCLAIMDQVQESGEPVLITKRGEPVAKLIPVKNRRRYLWLYDRESENHRRHHRTPFCPKTGNPSDFARHTCSCLAIA